MPTNDHSDLEARIFEQQEQKRHERLLELKEKNARDYWQLADCEEGGIEETIEPLGDEFYRLPKKTKKFLPRELIDRMHAILARVREINDDLAGIKVSRGLAILAGDQRKDQIEAELRTWAEDYVAARLARRNPKDQDIPFLTYVRLYDELVQDLEKLAFPKGSIHRCFLGDLTDHIPWLVYRATWAKDIEDVRDHGKPELGEGILKDLAALPIIEHHYTLYAWASERSLGEILGKVADSITGDPPDRDELLERMELLAADINEMRPYLVRNFNSEKLIVELCPGVTISWMWGLGRGVGLVPVARSEDEMFEGIHRARFGRMLQVESDGLLAVSPLPWLRMTGSEAEDLGHLHANLVLVEAIHRRLLEFYSKVDHHAVLERWRSRRDAPDAEEGPSEEEVAASCQLVVDQDEEDRSALRRKVRAIRSQRLFAILSDELGCEVRQGKGSEVVVYREGGRHFRLGHHKRNDHVPSAIVRELLDRVGIGFGEWVGAVGG